MSSLPKRHWLMLVLVAAAAGIVRGDPAKISEQERLTALVKQLGDNRFTKREEARKDLEAIGEKALPAIRAVLGSPDFELDTRARQVERNIMLTLRKAKELGLELALIEPGDFDMGSRDTEPNRREGEKQHAVKITKPFLLGKYEVTQEEYKKLMNTNPSWFSPDGGGADKVKTLDTKRFPVDRVSWFDAIEFCNRLSKQDGYEPYYKLADVTREEGTIREAKVTILGGNGFRLPTEAEWEFACRARTTSAFHYGAASTGAESNVKAVPPTGYAAPPRKPDLNRTTTVGSYKPNAWGLHDMHGNAAEWCEDWYDRDYYGKSPKSDPKGPGTGTHRILRGGSWLVSNASCRSASRFFHTPNEATYYCGFRVARSP